MSKYSAFIDGLIKKHKLIEIKHVVIMADNLIKIGKAFKYSINHSIPTPNIYIHMRINIKYKHIDMSYS